MSYASAAFFMKKSQLFPFSGLHSFVLKIILLFETGTKQKDSLMEKVKYGMIGFGGIAENRVAKEGFACDKNRFAPLKNAQLVAATDINQGRKGAAEALGLKWRASADELLADKDIQAVYVATNNATHVPLAVKALNAGKHVISEKPMATNSKDAEMLVRLAKEKGLD